MAIPSTRMLAPSCSSAACRWSALDRPVPPVVVWSAPPAFATTSAIASAMAGPAGGDDDVGVGFLRDGGDEESEVVAQVSRGRDGAAQHRNERRELRAERIADVAGFWDARGDHLVAGEDKADARGAQHRQLVVTAHGGHRDVGRVQHGSGREDDVGLGNFLAGRPDVVAASRFIRFGVGVQRQHPVIAPHCAVLAAQDGARAGRHESAGDDRGGLTRFQRPGRHEPPRAVARDRPTVHRG